MIELSQIFSKPEIVSALISACVAIFVNMPISFLLYLRNERLHRELTERTIAHAQQMEDIKHRNSKELEELKSSLDTRKLNAELKIKAREADRQENRRERKQLIENLKRLLDKVEDTFLTVDFNTVEGDETVIRGAQRAFDIYAQLSTEMRKLKGKIKHADYRMLSEVLDILADLCLDFARDGEDRKNPARQARVATNRRRLEGYLTDAYDAFKKALVPWEAE